MGSICRLMRNCKAGVKSCFQDSVSSCLGTSTFLGSSKVRRFSVIGKRPPPETCVMMGKNGLIVYPGKRLIDLDVFLDGKPLLDDVPSDRLFGKPDPRQPFMMSDASRRLLKSGLFLPYFCNIIGKSCSGAFTRENVGVIEDLGMIAYRKLEEDASHNWRSNPSAGYNEYSIFLKEVIYERHNLSSLRLLPKGLDHLLSCLDAIKVDSEFALHHPNHLSDEKYGNVLIEVHRILRNELRVHGKGRTAMNMLRRISVTDRSCVRICQGHPILNEYLPDWLKSPEFNLDVEGVYQGPEAVSLPTLDGCWDMEAQLGIVLVNLNRHGAVHSVDFNLFPLIDHLPDQCSKSLHIAPYTREEVIQLLRYKFPMYLPVVYKTIMEFQEWNSLGARLIDPIPSIFSAPSTFP